MAIASLMVMVSTLSSAAEIRIPDPLGDQTWYVEGQPLPDPAGVFAEVDLLEIVVTEHVRHVTFVVETATIPEDPSFQAIVNFEFGGQEYRLTIDDRLAPTATLNGVGVPPTPLVMTRDDAKRIIHIEKSDLIDAAGTAGAIGTDLTVTGARAWQGTVEDTVSDAATLTFEHGGQPAKDIRIGSPQPTRVSNGEATVYAFKLNVENLLGIEVVASLDYRELPAGWSVHFPADIVALEPRETRQVPVLVSVPFAHQHGTLQSFWVEARHLGETEILSDTELGVRYTFIPQLAGHHPKVWFHSASREVSPNPEGVLYFNTVEDDQNDEGLEALAKCYASPPEAPRVEYVWNSRMDTPLWLGLDFELNDTIDISIPVVSDREMAGLELSAHFYVDRNTVAEVTQAIDLRMGENELLLELRIDPRWDEFPVPPVGIVEFEIRLIAPIEPIGAACNLIAPKWMPGASAEFPLYEYHDPLPIDTSQLIQADGAPDRIQPGSRLVVKHEITADPNTNVRLRLFGHGSDHAMLRPGTAVKTSDQGRATFYLQVDIPSSANEGDAYDLIVEATAGNKIGLQRTAFVVASAGENRQDEAVPEDATRGTPAPGLIWVGLALFLARQRHDRGRH